MAWLVPLCRGSPKFSTQILYRSANRTFRGSRRMPSRIFFDEANRYGTTIGTKRIALSRNRRHTVAGLPMAKSFAKTFHATLEPSGMGLQSSFAFLPFDIGKTWPGLRVRRVKGEINGLAFRTALFPTPRGHGFFVNKKMLAGAGARQGDRAEIRIEPDLEQRREAMPEELAHAMRGAAGLRKWFEKLPQGHRRWIAQIITEPKSAASRQKRAEEMAERLYLTMEGGTETPPVLRAAFQRYPLAEAGWKALTAVQRRNHLFMIFGCRSAEAREKRVQAAMEMALAKVRGNSNAKGAVDYEAAERGSWSSTLSPEKGRQDGARKLSHPARKASLRRDWDAEDRGM
jgi:uncharacterized protein YdeI (YjbR/CyaY-like superfamily)